MIYNRTMNKQAGGGLEELKKMDCRTSSRDLVIRVCWRGTAIHIQRCVYAVESEVDRWIA